jgi:hypothetical protein
MKHFNIISLLVTALSLGTMYSLMMSHLYPNMSEYLYVSDIVHLVGTIKEQIALHISYGSSVQLYFVRQI